MTLEKLGEIIRRLEERFEREGRRDLLERMYRLIDRGDIWVLWNWAANMRLVSAQAAWTAHAMWLKGLKAHPPPARLECMIQRAYDWGGVVAARFQAVMVRERPGIHPRLWLKLAVRAGVRGGWAEGAREAAEEAGAGFKTWIRTWPAKEPRDWHDALEGKTIPANALFTLPGGPNIGAKVEAPHDWQRLPDPAEWINCGHAVVYTPHARLRDLAR